MEGQLWTTWGKIGTGRTRQSLLPCRCPREIQTPKPQKSRHCHTYNHSQNSNKKCKRRHDMRANDSDTIGKNQVFMNASSTTISSRCVCHDPLDQSRTISCQNPPISPINALPEVSIHHIACVKGRRQSNKGLATSSRGRPIIVVHHKRKRLRKCYLCSKNKSRREQSESRMNRLVGAQYAKVTPTAHQIRARFGWSAARLSTCRFPDASVCSRPLLLSRLRVEKNW